MNGIYMSKMQKKLRFTQITKICSNLQLLKNWTQNNFNNQKYLDDIALP